MEFRDKVIQDVYGGDTERYEREFDDAVTLANAVSWDDLLRSATVLTDWVQEAKDTIERFLGYLPDEAITIKYEPFLRSLLQQKHDGHLTPAAFRTQAEEHIRLIRNEEVKHNLMADYDAELYETYHTDYLPYGPMVKQRLIDMIGYAPDLQYSLLAELYLRKVMANDRIVLHGDMTPIDFKAITLIRYRQILLTRGQDVADNWPVLLYDEDEWV